MQALLYFLCLSFCLVNVQSLTCDKDHPCPSGLVCRSIRYLPGVKACVYRGAVDTGAVTKRSGRCPAPGTPQMFRLTTSCNGHQDCPLNQRCCPPTFGGTGACVDPQQITQSPTVTPLTFGYIATNSEGFDFIASTTLVQSNGFNVLVDSGTQRKTIELLKDLFEKAGLFAEDIDALVTTHGHPDHYGSLIPFSNIDQYFSEFKSNGIKYAATALRGNAGQLFINNDRNIEVIKTPGHTPQCISVIVRNVPDYGTVSIVGDLILFKNDGSDMYAFDKSVSEASRKKVVCMSDYVVPGHGVMYKVDAEQKTKFGC